MTRRVQILLGLGVAIVGGVLVYLWRRPSASAASPATAVPPLPGPSAGPRRIVGIGDSLTVGYLPRLKATGLPVDGQGWTGKQVAYIAEQAKGLLASNPTDVVVFAGTNDLASGRGSKKTGEALIALWRTVKATGARLVAVKLSPSAGNANMKKVAGEVAKLNAFIDTARGMDGGPDVVVDLSSMGDEQGRLRSEYAAKDGLHMTAAGYSELARLIGEAL